MNVLKPDTAGNNIVHTIINCLLITWLLAVTIAIIYILIHTNQNPLKNDNSLSSSQDKSSIEGIWEIKSSNGIESCWHFEADKSFTYINNSDKILTTGTYRYLYSKKDLILTDDYEGSQEEVYAELIDNDMLNIKNCSLSSETSLYYIKCSSEHVHDVDIANYKRINYSNGPITAEDIGRLREEMNKEKEEKTNHKP